MNLSNLHQGRQKDSYDLHQKVRLEDQRADRPPRINLNKIIRDAAQRAHCSHFNGTANDLSREIRLELKGFLNEELKGYKILEEIGYGGQAVVFKAIQHSIDREVALKVLSQGPFTSIQQRMRFLREIALISRLSHPNIVSIYDSGVVSAHHWFSMEYISRSLPLDDYILLHRPAIPVVIRLFETIVRAIAVAHQHGIIHRDIKPNNILMDADGIPHIADFGLAKDTLESSGSEEISITGQVVGTLPYLSPELADENQTEISVLTDIYSLGVVLYKLITGHFPYSVDGNPSEVRRRIQHSAPRNPRAVRAANEDNDLLPSGRMNDDLVQVILKALRKEKERRYQSASAFADDLDRLLKGEAVEAKSDNKLYVLRRLLRKHRAKVAIAGTFLLLIFASLLITTILWRRAENVSTLSQMVWDTSALNKLGSVARDESRYDDAIAMFQKSIEISNLTNIPNPTLLRNRFDACQRWSWICYERGDLDRGDRLCEAALSIAKRMVEADPKSILWKRYLAETNTSKGRGLYAYGKWTEALACFEQAAIQNQIVLNLKPLEPSLIDDLAHTQRWLGKCCLKLGRFDDAQNYFLDAKALCLTLVKHDQTNVQYLLNVIRCDKMLARCLLNTRNPKADTEADILLRTAQSRLDTLSSPELSDGLYKQIEQLSHDIEAYLKVIEKRSNRNIASPIL